MTRFGEKLKYLAKYFELLFSIFSIWRNPEPTLANFLCYWANIHCRKWSKLSTKFGHLVALALNEMTANRSSRLKVQRCNCNTSMSLKRTLFRGKIDLLFYFVKVPPCQLSLFLQKQSVIYSSCCTSLV